jgi:hypothetical protein
MRKVFKLFAFISGAIVMIAGFSSCNKQECCSVSGTEFGISYSSKICEDGSATSTIGSSTISGDWDEDYSSWAEAKADAEAEGASCSKEKK